MSIQKEVLENLNLGTNIAELDNLLEKTYVKSSAFVDFVNNRYDIIRGAKGTGKSALLLYAIANKSEFKQLDDTILIKANEHSGDPTFKKAFGKLSDDDKIETYEEAWKIYIINLIWPDIEYVVEFSDELGKYLNKKKILTKEKGILSRLLHAVFRAKAAVTHQDIEYSLQLGEMAENEYFVDYNYIFGEINDLLDKSKMCAWVLLDRLDDAFPDWSLSSQKAIKSLFYAYKALMGQKNIKLKTFIRNDIFDRITLYDGFTSLSHIKAISSTPIIWDEQSMMQFIINRFKTIFPDLENNDLDIQRILGEKVDQGSRKTDSFHWVLNHLKDGNSIYTPRDILDFLDTSRQLTLREMESKSFERPEKGLFTRNSLKKSWESVSQNKCETQLYAENPELRDIIELFRRGKSEYSISSMQKLLGDEYKKKCDLLEYVGFLSAYGDKWKIPFLYRPCLNIKQGKA